MGQISEALANAYKGLFITVVIILAVMICFCLVRAIKGPTIADRLVAVNMIGTMVIVIIAILSLFFEEGYIVDICIIYAMISFLSIIVLTKVYTGVFEEGKRREIEKDGDI